MEIGKIGGLRRIGEEWEEKWEETREETRDGIAWNGGEKGMYGAFLYLEL